MRPARPNRARPVEFARNPASERVGEYRQRWSVCRNPSPAEKNRPNRAYQALSPCSVPPVRALYAAIRTRFAAIHGAEPRGRRYRQLRNEEQRLRAPLYGAQLWILQSCLFSLITLGRRLFLHAALMNFARRLVGVDRIQVGMAAQYAPSDFFANIVDAFVAVDFDLVRGFGPLHSAFGFLSRGNDKNVIAAGPNACHVLTARDRGTQQRGRVMIGTIDVNDGVARRRGGLVEWAPLHRAADRQRDK